MAFLNRRTGDGIIPLAALLLGLSATGAVFADAKSDLFQPDVFGTEGLLQQRAAGLLDPAARDCPAPPATLSLSAAIDLALCRNPATRSAWASAREQAAALGAAEGTRLPSLTATGSESRYLGPHVDVTGNVATATQDTRDAALNVSWTLYDFGGRGGRIRSARRLLDAAAMSLNSTTQQTVLNAVQGFYRVVATDAALVAAKATESTAANSLEIARSLQEGGIATRADVLQSETAYDQAVISRIQAEATAASARGTLAVAVGTPANQAFTLEAEPVPAAVPALTARLADLMAAAARQRPDLAAAQSQRDAAEANVTVARAAGRPSISIQAGRTNSDTTGTTNQNYNQIGVYVTVPLFSGFSTGYGVRQAQAALAASEANADQIRLGVSLDVWNAYYTLDSANQQLAATATLTKTAENNQEVALGRYQSGVGTIIDVLTAQTAAANARVIRINAEFGWQVARAQLAFALGRLTGAEPLADVAALP